MKNKIIINYDRNVISLEILSKDKVKKKKKKLNDFYSFIKIVIIIITNLRIKN